MTPLTWLSAMTRATSSNLAGRMTGKSAGLASLNPAGVDAGLAICSGNAGTVAHQAAGRRETRQLMRLIWSKCCSKATDSDWVRSYNTSLRAGDRTGQ